MTYGACYSVAGDLDAAVADVCDEIAASLGGGPPDLAMLFVSHDHADRFDDLAGLVCRRSQARNLLGCTGEAIAGGSREIESGPAVSLWAAVLPGAEIETFHTEFNRTPDGIGCRGIPADLAQRRAGARAVLVLGEPYSTDPHSLIARLDDDLPGVPVIGGMASGGAGPGLNRVFRNSASLDHGAVGAIVRGGPRIRTVVSQGCRPIGKPFVVTRAEGNVIHQLGGVAPMQRFAEMAPGLSPEESAMARRGLHVGIVMNEYQETFARGDFLISNVMGASDEGALAIGSPVRTGQTVQFHVRDAATASEDLATLLAEDRDNSEVPARAALLFSCNGRGTRLFPTPHHDAAAIQQHAGPLPLAGFFAQGELGPVGGKNYIHGFTASIAFFE